MSRASPDAAKLNSRYLSLLSFSLERERKETRPMQCTRSLTRALKGRLARPMTEPDWTRSLLRRAARFARRVRHNQAIARASAAPLHAAVAAAFSVAFSRYGKADWAKCKNTGFIGRVYLA